MDSHVHAKDKPVDEIDGTAAQEGEETSATQRLLERGGDPIVRINYGAMQDPAGRQADVDETFEELAPPHTVGLDRDLNMVGGSHIATQSIRNDDGTPIETSIFPAPNDRESMNMRTETQENTTQMSRTHTSFGLTITNAEAQARRANDSYEQ